MRLLSGNQQYFSQVNNGIYSRCKGRMFESWIEKSMTFTSNYTTNILTTLNTIGNADNHYWHDNQPVRLTTTDTLPAGLAEDTTYYLLKISDGTIKLLDRANGSVIDFTDNGSGTHTIKRYTGFVGGDLIENPVYVIESIFRDEIFTERDLVAETGGAVNSVVCSQLLGTTQDYYRYAIYHDVDLDVDIIIRSYDETTKTFTLETNLSESSEGHKFYITNIQADIKLDTSSIDYVASKRSDWKAAFSLNQKIDSNNLFDKLLYECHCSIIQSQGLIKLIALDRIPPTNEMTLSDDGYWQIYTASQLNDARNDLTLNYRQMQDIDLSGYEDFAMFNGTFSGIYDGNGYKITGLTQTAGTNIGSYNYYGLFKDLTGTIKNLIIDTPHRGTGLPSTGKTSFAGVLVAAVASSTAVIENVKIVSPVWNYNYTAYGHLNYYMGLMCGYIQSGTIRKCSIDNFNINVNVKCTNIPQIGSLVGSINSSGTMHIEECYTTGTATVNRDGGSTLGGMFGYVAFATGDTIKNCYTISTLSANGDIGGFAYYLAGGNHLTNCYAASTFASYTHKAGFTYDNRISNSTCYFDSTVAGTTTAQGAGAGASANAKTTAEMKTQGTFTGWDFGKIWQINTAVNTGYPDLDNMDILPAEIVGAFTNPLKQNGEILLHTSFTPLSEVYTDFKLYYAYDYAKGDYTKYYFVNSKSYSAGITSLSDYQTLCSNAETDYRIKRKFEYKCDYIQDDATALSLLKKFVLNKTTIKLIVDFTGDYKNHVYYEEGDQVKINLISNLSGLLPTGYNNEKIFIITSKQHLVKYGDSCIKFTLEEMILKP